MKALVKKVMDKQGSTVAGEKAKEGLVLNRVSDLAVNEELQKQPLIDDEEEKAREIKFKNDHVEYLRVARKPL